MDVCVDNRLSGGHSQPFPSASASVCSLVKGINYNLKAASGNKDLPFIAIPLLNRDGLERGHRCWFGSEMDLKEMQRP